MIYYNIILLSFIYNYNNSIIFFAINETTGIDTAFPDKLYNLESDMVGSL